MYRGYDDPDLEYERRDLDRELDRLAGDPWPDEVEDDDDECEE